MKLNLIILIYFKMQQKQKTYSDNYLIAEENKNLIGKRAEFKKDLPDYSIHLLGKKGVIVNHKDSKFLSLKFDVPYCYGYKDSCKMETCFIRKGSINFLDEVKNEKNKRYD